MAATKQDRKQDRLKTAIATDQAQYAEFALRDGGRSRRVSVFEPFPFETFGLLVGGRNWVIARRTPRIMAHYGADVVCLSPQAYEKAERKARLMLTEGFD